VLKLINGGRKFWSPIRTHERFLCVLIGNTPCRNFYVFQFPLFSRAVQALPLTHCFPKTDEFLFSITCVPTLSKKTENLVKTNKIKRYKSTAIWPSKNIFCFFPVSTFCVFFNFFPFSAIHQKTNVSLPCKNNKLIQNLKTKKSLFCHLFTISTELGLYGSFWPWEPKYLFFYQARYEANCVIFEVSGEKDSRRLNW